MTSLTLHLSNAPGTNTHIPWIDLIDDEFWQSHEDIFPPGDTQGKRVRGVDGGKKCSRVVDGNMTVEGSNKLAHPADISRGMERAVKIQKKEYSRFF